MVSELNSNLSDSEDASNVDSDTSESEGRADKELVVVFDETDANTDANVELDRVSLFSLEKEE